MAQKNKVKKINMKLDHIAYAVKSTDEAIKAFSAIYPIVSIYKCVESSQNVYITYLSNDFEDYNIELIEGISSPNPIENLLSSKDVMLYHLCYKVNDFKGAIKYLKEKKFFMITSPFETSIKKGLWACHFFNPKSGIIEITGVIKDE